MDYQISIVRRKYDRNSSLYDLMESIVEMFFFAGWRRKLLSNVSGRVLEIGVGTGKNLQYYPDGVRIVAIDISHGMFARAVKISRSLPLDIEMVLADAENLPFKNGKFNTIVLTYVLCSVPHPVRSLREMGRVLGRSGQIMMLEHVLSKNILISTFERLYNPLTNWLIGVNIDRDTPGNIRKSGLEITEEENLAFKDVFKRIIAIRKTRSN